jgi:hypothetical protein
MTNDKGPALTPTPRPTPVVSPDNTNLSASDVLTNLAQRVAADPYAAVLLEQVPAGTRAPQVLLGLSFMLRGEDREQVQSWLRRATKLMLPPSSIAYSSYPGDAERRRRASLPRPNSYYPGERDYPGSPGGPGQIEVPTAPRSAGDHVRTSSTRRAA